MGKVKLQKSIYKKTKDVRWHITIPAEYIADKKWKKGQELMLTYNKDANIVIRELPKEGRK